MLEALFVATHTHIPNMNDNDDNAFHLSTIYDIRSLYRRVFP